jgi:hypothetical protein
MDVSNLESDLERITVAYENEEQTTVANYHKSKVITTSSVSQETMLITF